jgi:transcription antitermination factor NusG
MINCKPHHWYAAYTLPNYEKRVLSLLEKKNFNVYLPLQKVVRQWSDRKKQLQVPLFPSYIFINMAEAQRFEICNVSGISRLISQGGKPVIVKEWEIDTIRLLENERLEVEQEIIEGDDVKIIEGPFAGLKGKIFVKKGRERFCVRLNSFNQSLSLELSIASILKV